MAKKRMMILQSDPELVYVTDADGLEVTFHNFEEYTFYTGKVGNPDDHITYEPERDMYFINGVKQPEAFNADYEDSISRCQEYLDYQADPLYGLEGQELIDAQKELDREAAERVYAETCSAPVTIDGVTYKGGESSASGISSAVQLSQAGGAETCFIADIYNIVREMSFEDALAVSGQIGMITYEAFIVRANTLADIDSNDGV